jgi:uncharacterized protein YndB with AHSA1/START domain
VTETLGALRADGVRFERLYDATPEELWSAITDPEQIEGWLAHVARIDLQPDGQVELEMEADGSDPVRGRIRELQSERVLEYDWRSPDAPDSVLRFEIVPRDTGGTMLALEHRRLPREVLVDYGAGWHAHLDGLSAHVAGRATEFWGRFHELRPRYKEGVASLP